MPKKVVILGAGGRDFHNFNRVYRDDEAYEVSAFTATQIPGIADRRYPSSLAGPRYPDGIPIVPEADLEKLIRTAGVEEAVFAYSDVSHAHVMGLASRVIAAGASFRVLGVDATSVSCTKPVVSITAVRTGAGKSQTTRRVAEILKRMRKRVVAVRHPMPYGDLTKQNVQRFSTLEDLDRNHCTIEEREEYEPHLLAGNVVFAGIDYAKIAREAEKEADVLLWDGGNNDFPFFRADLRITVADPHRPGHELLYFPGEVNFRMADVIVINKIDTARPEDVETVRANIARANPSATVVEAASPVTVDQPSAIKGRRVLVVEDGPTVTHGDMRYGAGVVAARKHGAAAVVDPRPFLVGSLRDTFRQYPDIGSVLPAMGYGERQIRDLEATIEASDSEVVVIATPIDLTRLIKVTRPVVRVRYSLFEIGSPNLEEILESFFESRSPD
jgi:predicted GTPase